jgi:hypothetical protein
MVLRDGDVSNKVRIGTTDAGGLSGLLGLYNDDQSRSSYDTADLAIKIYKQPHLADTTAVTITGWTTDATRYIQIEAASSHGGKWNDNIYRLITSTSGSTVECAEKQPSGDRSSLRSLV